MKSPAPATSRLTIAHVTASNPTGLVCSGLIWGPPVVDPSGDASTSTSLRRARRSQDVAASSITYQGNGSLIYDSARRASDPTVVSGDGSAASCIDPGAGINVVTFTNSRTAGYVTRHRHNH